MTGISANRSFRTLLSGALIALALGLSSSAHAYEVNEGYLNQLKTGQMCLRCILSHADLRNANLSKINLRKSTFWRANLSGANLSGADLRGSLLGGANLRGPNGRGTKWPEGFDPEAAGPLPGGE